MRETILMDGKKHRTGEGRVGRVDRVRGRAQATRHMPKVKTGQIYIAVIGRSIPIHLLESAEKVVRKRNGRIIIMTWPYNHAKSANCFMGYRKLSEGPLARPGEAAARQEARGGKPPGPEDPDFDLWLAESSKKAVEEALRKGEQQKKPRTPPSGMSLVDRGLPSGSS